MEYQLKADDFVGVTFWIISVSMVASTAFFFFEANSVSKHWQTSVRVLWTSYINRCSSLLLHERCMGRNRRITNCLQIY